MIRAVRVHLLTLATPVALCARATYCEHYNDWARIESFKK